MVAARLNEPSRSIDNQNWETGIGREKTHEIWNQTMLRPDHPRRRLGESLSCKFVRLATYQRGQHVDRGSHT